MINASNTATKIALASVLMGFTLANPAGAKEFSSQSQATDVIELYTSEGCSSCPRADRWLSALRKKPELFRDMIPMSFHVDYWDYIGWKDRFANPAYSLRQRQHVTVGNSRQTYTPQFITNSSEWRAWFSGGERKWDNNDKTVGVLKASLPDHSKTIHVTFNPQTPSWSSANSTRPTNYVLNVAVLGMGLQSTVTAGENVNHVLRHDFVVLNHDKQTVAANPAKWHINMPAVPDSGQTKSAIAVWLSEPDTQKIIQATGGYL